LLKRVQKNPSVRRLISECNQEDKKKVKQDELTRVKEFGRVENPWLGSTLEDDRL
jgi:hypothetical protein